MRNPGRTAMRPIGVNHKGDANFMFLDWHAEWYPRARWPKTDGSGCIAEWFPWNQ